VSFDDAAAPPPRTALPSFDELVAEHRRGLFAHCYRMLGSLADAEDALQETLLGAWRGLAGFEGRSSPRAWLYQIATHACFRVAQRRPSRRLPEVAGSCVAGLDAEARDVEPAWLEPYPDSPEDSLAQRQAVELSFVAALQHLPPRQRGVLLLRDVLGFSADETASMTEQSVASINSALSRAREAVRNRVPPSTQQATRAALGEARERVIVERYMAAWADADPEALRRLLADDVTFSMPPMPSWFEGRDAVVRFFAERVFGRPWRLVPVSASGQVAFLCRQAPDHQLSAVNVVTLREDKIAKITGFLHQGTLRFFLPEAASAEKEASTDEFRARGDSPSGNG
jgi:RNA polymerase sigma-70 factor (TIGR02960 family)